MKADVTVTHLKQGGSTGDVTKHEFTGADRMQTHLFLQNTHA